MAILFARADLNAPAEQFSSRPLITARDTRTIGYALNLSTANDIRRLVVVDDADDFIGVVTQKDILRHLEEDIYRSDILVKHIAEQLRDLISAVPILEAGKAIGIIMEKDILKVANIMVSINEPVSHHMSKPVICADVERLYGAKRAGKNRIFYEQRPAKRKNPTPIPVTKNPKDLPPRGRYRQKCKIPKTKITKGAGMKNKSFYTLFCTFLVTGFFAALVSCGGGGGSSSGILYTGESSQAQIDEVNAVDLLTGAYLGGDMSQLPLPLGSVALAGNDQGTGSTLLAVPRMLKEAVDRIDAGSMAMGTPVAGVINDSQTIDGTCGGSATFSISFDEVTGEFSGTFTFSSYDECTEVLNGTMQFSGAFEVLPGGEPGEIINMRMTFNAISVTGSEPVTIAGEITIAVNDPDETITMDILLHDGLSDKIFWVNNYTITVTQGAGFTDVSVTGTFFNPDEGFVTLTTPVLLRILDFDMWPSGGTLEIAGANGTKARLTANSDGTTFFVLVELSGDDGFDDWDSRDFGTLFWTDV